MAVSSQVVDAPIEDVFAFLTDGSRYDEWVVGAKQIRRVDEAWPAPETAFHHSVGLGPLSVDDSTTVQRVAAPMKLELEVRTRPFLIAEVTFELEAESDRRTRVVMRETITGGLLGSIGAALDPIIAARNTESLRRLRQIVESTA